MLRSHLYDRCQLNCAQQHFGSKKIFFSLRESTGKIMKFRMRCRSARSVRTWACHTCVSLSFFTITFLLRSVLSRWGFCVFRFKVSSAIGGSVLKINWINCARTQAICHSHTICGIFMRAHRNNRRFQMKHENYVNWSAVCARCPKKCECADRQCELVIRQRIIMFYVTQRLREGNNEIWFIRNE